MGNLIDQEASIAIAERYGCNNGSALGRHSGVADCIAFELAQEPAVDVRPQWINVKDRLPCEYGNYLAVVNGEVMECLYSVPNIGSNSAWSTCDAYGFKFIPETEITYWMPLPKPPEEET